jgi:hypothetical protein
VGAKRPRFRLGPRLRGLSASPQAPSLPLPTLFPQPSNHISLVVRHKRVTTVVDSLLSGDR